MGLRDALGKEIDERTAFVVKLVDQTVDARIEKMLRTKKLTVVSTVSISVDDK